MPLMPILYQPTAYDSFHIFADLSISHIILTGLGSLKVYILWYGNFNHSEKDVVFYFIVSIGRKVPTEPSVSRWWETTQHYKDSAERGVSAVVQIGGQASDALCTHGNKLKRSDIAMVVRRSLVKRLFSMDDKGMDSYG